MTNFVDSNCESPVSILKTNKTRGVKTRTVKSRSPKRVKTTTYQLAKFNLLAKRKRDAYAANRPTIL